jgi:hypothetical protein
MVLDRTRTLVCTLMFIVSKNYHLFTISFNYLEVPCFTFMTYSQYNSFTQWSVTSVKAYTYSKFFDILLLPCLAILFKLHIAVVYVLSCAGAI